MSSLALAVTVIVYVPTFRTYDEYMVGDELGLYITEYVLNANNYECILNCFLDDCVSFKSMLTLAVATSIDALAVGVMFAFIKVNIVPAVIFIGTITFSLSIVGIKVGNVFGARFKSKAEIAGGIILICMGIKILIEHLFLS